MQGFTQIECTENWGCQIWLSVCALPNSCVLVSTGPVLSLSEYFSCITTIWPFWHTGPSAPSTVFFCGQRAPLGKAGLIQTVLCLFAGKCRFCSWLLPSLSAESVATISTSKFQSNFWRFVLIVCVLRFVVCNKSPNFFATHSLNGLRNHRQGLHTCAQVQAYFGTKVVLLSMRLCLEWALYSLGQVLHL